MHDLSSASARSPRFDPDTLRLSLEREILSRLTAHPLPFEARLIGEGPDVETIRRELLASALRLGESMAPELHARAKEAARRLGVTEPIEIYQADGPENAAVHLLPTPVVLEAQGRLLALLDEGSALALFGHELGHFLVHGPRSQDAVARVLLMRVLRRGAAPEDVLAELRALSMACELTADRFALLACGELDAFLRLEMISTTGLSASSLTWDTAAYLAQCQELIGRMLEAGDVSRGVTHPEHSVRAYAAWLFSETKEYRALLGRGAGTRTLADVDRELARVLRRRFEREVVDIYEPIPQEVHQCALAAAVLVAAADGAIDAREIEVIERAFDGLVAEWRAYLDPDTARARLFEVAPIVTALGEGPVRAVFAVLTHVMLADEQIVREELAMILAIGELLQAEALFIDLLVPTLRALSSAIDITTVTKASVPIPVSAHEAAAALDAFLRNVSHRGTRVTLRRLLRLAGHREPNEAAAQAIQRAIARARVDVAPPLSFAELDAPVTLMREPPREGARATKPVLRADRISLCKAIGRLRDDLVDGDGRSPSVRLREPRTGRIVDLYALEGISTGLAERVLTSVRAHKPARLFEASLETKMPEAKRLGQALIALEREHRSRHEETGADDLFVGYPLLAGVIDGYVVRGPLVLYPVRLASSQRGARSYAFEPKDDEPFVNQSLLRAIFHKRKQPLAESFLERLDALAAEPGDVADAILAELKSAGIDGARLHADLRPLTDDLELLERAKNAFQVVESAVLGLFPQSSSSILQEYDGMLGALDSPAADVHAVLGSACALLPSALRPASTPLPQGGAPVRPAIFADPSQRAVIREARSGRGLVIDGPPGTGKSQVIANLITDALSRGERVAVVCEKRAALDVVVQRLDQLGLRPLLGLVHDVHDDRKELFAQVASRLETASEGRPPARSDVRDGEHVEAEATRCEAALHAYASAMRAKAQPNGPSLGELHSVAAGFDEPPLPSCPSLVHLDPSAVVALVERLAALREYTDLLAPDAELRRVSQALGRASLAGASLHDIGDLTLRLAAAAEATDKLDRLERHRLGRVREAERALLAAHGVAQSLAGASSHALFMRIARVLRDAPQRFADVQALLSDLAPVVRSAIEAQRPLRVDVPPGLYSALVVFQRWAARLLRFFAPSFWRARAELRRALPRIAPELVGADLSARTAAVLARNIEAARAWQLSDRVHLVLDASDMGPFDGAALGVRNRELAELLEPARVLHASREALLGVDAWPDRGVGAWRQVIETRRALLATDREATRARHALADRLPALDDDTPASALALLRDLLVREGTRVCDADRAIENTALALLGRSDQHANGAALQLLDAVAHAQTSDAAARLVYKTWATQLIALAEARSPDARLLEANADEDAEHGLRLGALEDERARCAAARVWSACDAAEILTAELPGKHKRRSEVQATREELLKEARKQRRIMPLRTFARRFAPRGLLDVLPVWLVSPETVVTLFPAEPLFDLVIFDEASQCTVSNGFPVFSRAKRFVIAGDDKQMPPSSFFAAKARDDEDDAEEDADSKRDRTLLEEESLLTLAAARLPRRSLSWHYRCRHESLIAFSNAAFYAGELKTIPATASPTSAPAIHWVAVENGAYEGGVNAVEAERVVDAIAELIARPDQPTVGVVTFNLKQRSAILDAIEARRSTSEAFAASWDRTAGQDDLDQRPFVKNLEQVQGDERDVIVFSLGHAPIERTRKDGTRELYVPARFGPLGQRGGERRLNVAISRAKQEILVVASFSPHLLNTANAKNAGPALFKGYLEYARHAAQRAHARAQRVLATVAGDAHQTQHSAPPPLLPGALPLAVQIAAALEEHGYGVELHVGVSGFRVPVAVYSRTDATRFGLAVLTDEGAGAQDVFETHVHLRRVLEQRGWKVLRVTSPQWHRRRERVIAKIRALL
jgi:hypothetical protein